MSKKWTTLYKYISAEHAAEIIQSQRLRMGDGSNFNDPFELLVVDRKKNTERRIEGLRILCLTNSIKKKLMWSHYADSHKGLCLAVKVPADVVYYVCYTGDRLFADSDIEKIFSNCKNKGKENLRKSYDQLSDIHKAALIKDQKWAYEKEYRIVCTDDQTDLIDKEGYYSFPVKIERVYLGCRFDKNDLEKIAGILKACRDHNVEIKRMRLSYDNYSLIAEKTDDGGTAALIGELAAPF